MPLTSKNVNDAAQALAAEALTAFQQSVAFFDALDDKYLDKLQEIGYPSFHAATQMLAESTGELRNAIEETLADGEVEDEELVAMAPKMGMVDQRAKDAVAKGAAIFEKLTNVQKLSPAGMQFIQIGQHVVNVKQGVPALAILMGRYLDGEGDDETPGPDPSPGPGLPGPEGGRWPDDKNLHDGADHGTLESQWDAYKTGAKPFVEGKYLDLFCSKNETGFTFGKTGWTETRDFVPFFGPDKIVRVFGHPERTYVESVADEPGWGATVVVMPGGGWGGRIWFYELDVEESGGNNWSIGSYGTQAKVPLNDVRRYRCRDVEHPDKSIRTARVCSVNQTVINDYDCECDVPDAWEWDRYLRNCPGGSGRYGHRTKACGAGIDQQVNRPEEGPNYPKGVITWEDFVAHDYHRDPSRAGSCLTVAGTGHDVVIRDGLLYDILEPNGNWGRTSSRGAFVVWGPGNTWPNENGKRNGKTTIENVDVIHFNPDRSNSLSEGEGVLVKGCGIFNDNGREAVRLHQSNTPAKAEGCNTAAIRQRAIEKMKRERDVYGVKTVADKWSKIVDVINNSDPDVKYEGSVVGKLSAGFATQ